MNLEPCPICPVCQSVKVHWLKSSSEDAMVDYCRCEVCGHVWNVPKRGDGTIRHVTDPSHPAE
jgi:hypothetical protein